MNKQKQDKIHGGPGAQFKSQPAPYHDNRRGRSFRTEESSAVSSVVALMLILAVVATFISLYSTSYIPALKEQSEISQITEVKESFMKFSGDMEHIVAEKIPVSCSNVVPLGAGEILLSPEKSSGTLSVTDCGTMVEIRTKSGNSEPDAVSGMVNVAFRPSYTFWEEQGYTWQCGYINVTKNEKEVPLTDFTMEDLLEGEKFSTFAKSFITFEDEGEFNAGSGMQELKSLKINVVNIVPAKTGFISGNSATTLGILSGINDIGQVNTSCLSLSFVNSTDMSLMSEFSKHISEKTEVVVNDLSLGYCNVPSPVITRGIDGHDTITVDMDASSPPVEVAISSLNISVSA